MFIHNQEQFFVRSEGLLSFHPNYQWGIQLYYPEGQLRLGSVGRDIHFDIPLITLRINSDNSGKAFGIKVLGFGFGIQRISDSQIAKDRLLHEKFNRMETERKRLEAVNSTEGK